MLASVFLEKKEIEKLTKGILYNSESVSFAGVAIDSRRVLQDNMFACIIGERVDGHDFVSEVIDKGASFILATKFIDCKVPLLVVENIETALGQFAKFYRKQQSKTHWIGVTGSNGKTTVKEMLKVCLPESYATEGNFNNFIGMPLSILNTPKNAKYSIIEMGTNAIGEIEYLSEILKADTAVITNIGKAHLEGLGNLEGVAIEKSELFSNCEGACYFGSFGLADTKIFSLLKYANDFVSVDYNEEMNIDLQLIGTHNQANAQLCLKVTEDLGEDRRIAVSKLCDLKAYKGRARKVKLKDYTVIDDCYNANPESMKAAILSLEKTEGKKLAVLGYMGELGADSDKLHKEIGELILNKKIKSIVIGEQAEKMLLNKEKGSFFANIEEAKDEILRHTNHTILVKGSRSCGLEVVVEFLEKQGK